MIKREVAGIVVACAMAALWGTAAIAAQHPGRAKVGPPPQAVIDRGLSLEHECLNAVRATRATPRMLRPAPNDQSRHDAAAIHLDQAEQSARAGRGQDCQDQVSLAMDDWQ